MPNSWRRKAQPMVGMREIDIVPDGLFDEVTNTTLDEVQQAVIPGLERERAKLGSLQGPSVKTNTEIKCSILASNMQEFSYLQNIEVVSNNDTRQVVLANEEFMYFQLSKVNAASTMLQKGSIPPVLASMGCNLKAVLQQAGGVVVCGATRGPTYIRIPLKNFKFPLNLPKLNIRFLKTPADIGGVITGVVMGAVDEILGQTLKGYPKLLKWIRRIVMGVVTAVGLYVPILFFFLPSFWSFFICINFFF